MPPKNPTLETPPEQTPPNQTPPNQTPLPTGESKPFEQWAAEKGTADWQLAALTAFKNHPQGREVTEVEFNTSLEQALKQPVG